MGEKEPRSKVLKRVSQPPRSDHFNNIPSVFYLPRSSSPCSPSCAHESHSAAGMKTPYTTASSTQLIGGPGTQSYTDTLRAGGEKEQQGSCAISRRDALRQDAGSHRRECRRVRLVYVGCHRLGPVGAQRRLRGIDCVQ